MATPSQTDNDSVLFFDAFDPTSASLVYDSSGGTDVDAGMVLGYLHNRKTIGIKVSTLNSTSITVQIEMRFRPKAMWFTYWRKVYTAPGSDVVSLIDFHSEFVRVGVSVAGDVAGDSITIIGSWKTK